MYLVMKKTYPNSQMMKVHHQFDQDHVSEWSGKVSWSEDFQVQSDRYRVMPKEKPNWSVVKKGMVNTTQEYV